MAAKPTTTQRGYGTAHRQQRAAWQPIVTAGQAHCARCGKQLQPNAPWDLGHTDDRTAWTGPEHPHCNRQAGGRQGANITNTRRRATTHVVTREW